MLDEANPPFSACIRCGTCDGFPCLVHAKSDAEVLGVRPALEFPNVTLVTNARAVRLATNPGGTEVTGVEVDHEGAREVFDADLYVLSCGAANSAKLLLGSASDAHPGGLANGSDQVAVDFWLSTEDLPVPENRVTLERDGNVKLSYSARNATAAGRLYPPAQVDAGPPSGCTRTI
jgi:hypothetical protein